MRRLSRQLSTIASLAGGVLALCCLVAAAQTATRIPHRGPVAEKPRALFRPAQAGLRRRPLRPLSTREQRSQDLDDRRHAQQRRRRTLDAMGVLPGKPDRHDRQPARRRGQTDRQARADDPQDNLRRGMGGLHRNLWHRLTNKVVQCRSTGVLEEDVLHVIGATEH